MDGARQESGPRGETSRVATRSPLPMWALFGRPSAPFARWLPDWFLRSRVRWSWSWRKCGRSARARERYPRPGSGVCAHAHVVLEEWEIEKKEFWKSSSSSVCKCRLSRRSSGRARDIFLASNGSDVPILGAPSYVVVVLVRRLATLANQEIELVD